MTFRSSLPFTVYLVDMDMSTGDVLRSLLASVQISLETFGGPTDFLEASARARMQGCLLLSVRLPEMSGFELHRLLEERGVDLPTIFLGHGGDVPSAVQAMKLGAIDYFERPLAYQQLLERIQAVLRQETRRRRRQREVDRLRQRMGELTQRETQVLEQVVRGKLNKQIASALRISQKTVEMHRARMMAKLRARNIADLVFRWCAAHCEDVLGTDFLDDLFMSDSDMLPIGDGRVDPARRSLPGVGKTRAKQP